MNILHTEASTGWGGQDMRVLWEAREMGRRGHKVVLACAAGCPLWEAAQGTGIILEPVQFAGKLRWSDVKAVRGLIRKHAIEVVNTHSSGDGWSGAVAARLEKKRRPRGLPVCVRTRHLANKVKSNLPNNLLYNNFTDFIITTGEAVRRQFIAENSVTEDRILSIPTGVMVEEFDPAKWPRAAFRQEFKIPDGDFLWGMVAMIRRIKGHMVLAEAAALLLKERPQARFIIVGDIPSESPLRHEFETKLHELKIIDRFLFTGYREDVANTMAGCDAIVQPSLSEGLPQATTQALSMAKPVAASAVGGLPEVVRDGETGLLVPPSDPPALAQAMQRIMDDPAAARAMGEKGRTLILQQYSLAAMTDRVEQVYRQLLAKAGYNA